MKNKLKSKFNNAVADLEYRFDEAMTYIEELEADLEQKDAKIAELEERLREAERK